MFNQGVLYYNNVDPAHPTALISTNKIDPNYHSSKDNEIIVGIDREQAGTSAWARPTRGARSPMYRALSPASG